jgi:hypothetical protein
VNLWNELMYLDVKRSQCMVEFFDVAAKTMVYKDM